MAQESQWLTSRSRFSDWRTDRQTEVGSKVSLQYQHQGIAHHPLPMGAQYYCVGLFPVALRLVKKSVANLSELIGTANAFTTWPQDEAFSVWDNRPALGYVVPGRRVAKRSRFYDGDAVEQFLFDFLATEDGRPIVTEDTNEGLGLG